jgi:sulfate/thiosulfate transport system ATP-binding protein
MEQPMSLVVESVAKRFDRFPALKGVSFTAPKGCFLALLGPSGSGKTTLLRILGGLEFAEAGRVKFDDTEWLSIPARERRAGFVFQQYALFRHMTVAKNIAFGLEVRGRRNRPPRAEITRRVEELLALVQLEGLGRRYPSQLSGGQRQRVAIARALAVEPSVILCDEPISMLDVSIRIGILNLILGLKRESQIAFLYITHDIASARYVADEVLVMYRGRIVEQGPTDAVLQDPQHAYTRLLLSAVPNPESGLRLEPLVRGVLDEDVATRLVEHEPNHLVRRPA